MKNEEASTLIQPARLVDPESTFASYHTSDLSSTVNPFGSPTNCAASHTPPRSPKPATFPPASNANSATFDSSLVSYGQEGAVGSPVGWEYVNE
jgi:hypothetical protein